MARWRRIVCAVDFSGASRAAMEEAAEVVRDLRAELTLVHVDDGAGRPMGAEALAAPEAVERIPLEVERQLGEWCVAAEAIAGAAVDEVLLHGDPAAEILRLAAERGFDAVVLGTHGRDVRERLVFGSVAQAVVRDATCSVLVVRGAGRTEALRAAG
jgi:nucleotide-binding universal stress UspA family protein